MRPCWISATRLAMGQQALWSVEFTLFSQATYLTSIRRPEFYLLTSRRRLLRKLGV